LVAGAGGGCCRCCRCTTAHTRGCLLIALIRMQHMYATCCWACLLGWAWRAVERMLGQPTESFNRIHALLRSCTSTTKAAAGQVQ